MQLPIHKYVGMRRDDLEAHLLAAAKCFAPPGVAGMDLAGRIDETVACLVCVGDAVPAIKHVAEMVIRGALPRDQLQDMTEPDLKELMQVVGDAIKLILGGGSKFTLLCWDDPATVQYLATTNRADTIRALQELLARMTMPGGDPSHVERVTEEEAGLGDRREDTGTEPTDDDRPRNRDVFGRPGNDE